MGDTRSVLDYLPRVVPEEPGRPDLAGDDHPMRKVTRQVAFEPGAWTPERAAKVVELFDSLAPTWAERDGGGREGALRTVLGDALDRGGPFPRGRCLEVGCGTGSATPLLAERFSSVLALDLSYEMLCRVPSDLGGRVLADGYCLPLRSASAAAVALVNALLFPAEVERVLEAGGVVIWVSTLGDRTPIYLPAEDVAAALPGNWDVVASEAGWGSWAVLRRAPRVM